ncbi:hypothetical protein TNCT_379961 [Trichonephila clavata]|uniref:Uncharacterized protein n=1 Tax=Trichonephila clavata TaxID=2740835 RepID=A0A8X6GM46_TRICU|nr:hypothetical protein TNCT_379961 [Trichonephila clavata]
MDLEKRKPKNSYENKVKDSNFLLVWRVDESVDPFVICKTSNARTTGEKTDQRFEKRYSVLWHRNDTTAS